MSICVTVLAPGQRGTNENTNGLLRQWWPRSTNFYTLDPGEIQRVQTLLNARPRHTLGWQTPAAAPRTRRLTLATERDFSAGRGCRYRTLFGLDPGASSNRET
jgi:hypothetical protein